MITHIVASDIFIYIYFKTTHNNLKLSFLFRVDQKLIFDCELILFSENGMLHL